MIMQRLVHWVENIFNRTKNILLSQTDMDSQNRYALWGEDMSTLILSPKGLDMACVELKDKFNIEVEPAYFIEGETDSTDVKKSRKTMTNFIKSCYQHPKAAELLGQILSQHKYFLSFRDNNFLRECYGEGIIFATTPRILITNDKKWGNVMNVLEIIEKH